jgi:hypothetical protein
MKSISPVVPGLEPYEIKIGGPSNNQPETVALIGLRSPEGRVLMRWKPEEDERTAIAAGADVYVTLETFNEPFRPLTLQVMRADVDPALIVQGMDLDDELAIRMLHQNMMETYAEFEQRKNLFEARRADTAARISQRYAALRKAPDVNKGSDDQGTDTGQ